MRVPVLAHELADPEKGIGIAMICTFGDVTDVIWWRALSLPVRAIIQPNGALQPVDVGQRGLGVGQSRRARRAAYDQLANLSAVKARTRIVELLRESGDLIGDPRPITHAVKFYEKGDRPLEIVSSRQWFIKTMDFRERAAAAGARAAVAPGVHAGASRELDQRPERRLVHQPSALLRRAVSGLVSGAEPTASRDYAHPIVPAEDRAADRSVDRRARRLSRRPARSARRFTRRSRRHGHLGDLVADAADRRQAGEDDPDLFARVFPMDVRPQAHDIIRTWLFSTVLRSHLEFDVAAVGARRDLRLGPRSRPQEDVEVEGQRRDADGAARGARLRRRALLGGQRPARQPTPRSTRAR